MKNNSNSIFLNCDRSLRLSPHFRLSEFLNSSVATTFGLSNCPSIDHIINMTRLCTLVLEPLRLGLKELHKIPFVRISSGFRSPEVNEKVHGVKNSQHIQGLAADIQLISPLSGLYVRANDFNFCDILKNYLDVIFDFKLPFDQLIVERKGNVVWLHISIASVNSKPRYQALNIPDWYEKPLPF